MGAFIGTPAFGKMIAHDEYPWGAKRGFIYRILNEWKLRSRNPL